jgi:predicted enzyme related to lactoylglutathione lyase
LKHGFATAGTSNLNNFRFSINMPRVVHFEIVADNPERAIKFYKEVFGWEFKKWDGPQDYWFVKTGEDNQA